MPTSYTGFYLEEIAGFAHALKGFVRVEDNAGGVLAQADLSAVADDENAVDDGVVVNSAGITMPPSVNGTAVWVRWYNSDPTVAGVLVATDVASEVMSNLTVQVGTDVTIAIGADSTTVAGA